MKTLLTSLALALTLSLAGCATTGYGSYAADPDAVRALAGDGPVTVEWTDPEQFTEILHSRNRWEARRGTWVEDLATHLRDGAAERIGPGEQLHFVITDIRRAGDFEPGRAQGRMDHVRIMRDIYWPRMTVELAHYDAAGNLIASGEHRLSDPSYLSSQAFARSNTDPLRYEKAMIDRWLRQEFGPAR